jgi:TonB family protein
MTIEHSTEQEIGSGLPPKRASGRLAGRQGVLWLVLAVLLAMTSITAGEEIRRLKSGDPPEYPELAKKLNIRGIARIQATVAPDGSVKEIKELGGNPVLLQALVSAVRKWKYEPMNRTSSVEVRFAFPSE